MTTQTPLDMPSNSPGFRGHLREPAIHMLCTVGASLISTVLIIVMACLTTGCGGGGDDLDTGLPDQGPMRPDKTIQPVVCYVNGSPLPRNVCF
jgi:hypothetical protein